jgi:hypothetical protein
MHKHIDPFLSSRRASERRRTALLLALFIIATSTTFLIMKHHYVLLFSSLSGALAGRMWTGGNAPVLRFNRNGAFAISVFEDLHFGEGEDNRKYQSSTKDRPRNLTFQKHLNGDGDQSQTSKPSKS